MGGGRVSRGLGGGRASRGKELGQPRRSTAAVAAVYRVHEEEGWTSFFQKIYNIWVFLIRLTSRVLSTSANI
jgi:hypothetical protein